MPPPAPPKEEDDLQRIVDEFDKKARQRSSAGGSLKAETGASGSLKAETGKKGISHLPISQRPGATLIPDEVLTSLYEY